MFFAPRSHVVLALLVTAVCGGGVVSCATSVDELRRDPGLAEMVLGLHDADS